MKLDLVKTTIIVGCFLLVLYFSPPIARYITEVQERNQQAVTLQVEHQVEEYKVVQSVRFGIRVDEKYNRCIALFHIAGEIYEAELTKIYLPVPDVAIAYEKLELLGIRSHMDVELTIHTVYVKSVFQPTVIAYVIDEIKPLMTNMMGEEY